MCSSTTNGKNGIAIRAEREGRMYRTLQVTSAVSLEVSDGSDRIWTTEGTSCSMSLGGMSARRSGEFERTFVCVG